ncbi:hypothetical protein Ae201684P_000911 [Aphanomyces euteiches]|uniref:Uncharacterized protein n=1 Tax=Aphanomyces euteiches TaxID=100861 RepID=A0A6G0XR41_9STRA|nr:hypothetical protein Ae201684_002291 [Aphanomyces euteiches]KAH9087507.1 hypothetical protein Ae201684P_000911 [Aphanomyces euteiches]
MDVARVVNTLDFQIPISMNPNLKNSFPSTFVCDGIGCRRVFAWRCTAWIVMCRGEMRSIPNLLRLPCECGTQRFSLDEPSIRTNKYGDGIGSHLLESAM